MVQFVGWALCTYIALKFVQYFLVQRPGFQDAEPTTREKLLRGEPVVFIVAWLISAPPLWWSSWYSQHGYQRGLDHSADCYGRLAAWRELPAVEPEFDALQLYKTVLAAKRASATAAQRLEIAPSVVGETLAAKRSFYAARFSSTAGRGDRQGMRDEARAIERCLREPLINI